MQKDGIPGRKAALERGKPILEFFETLKSRKRC
jgi:hypothetical protein